jgi:amidohydrolase
VPSTLQDNVHRHSERQREFVIGCRRSIHEHPELGNLERQTAALVVDALSGLGLEMRAGVGGTGVMATLRGAYPGKTIALRADMDALPVSEESACPYRSQVPGVMHACGHDGHVAMLLGAARVLVALREHLHGNVRFLFQPAEETYGGAGEMIAAGCLADPPRVDAVFGLHIDPYGNVGELRMRSGAIMASADALRVIVRGVGGHAGDPHACVDPVPVAAQLITGLQTFVTRRCDARNPIVVSITYLHAGSAFNVIPAEVVLAGTVRTVDEAVRATLPARIEELSRHTAAAFGASAEVAYVRGTDVVMNDSEFTSLVGTLLGATRSVSSVVEMEHPLMGAEDFGVYLAAVPGTFAFLGARPPGGEPYPWHHPRFDFDERALPVGVEILATVAMGYLMPDRVLPAAAED